MMSLLNLMVVPPTQQSRIDASFATFHINLFLINMGHSKVKKYNRKVGELSRC